MLVSDYMYIFFFFSKLIREFRKGRAFHGWCEGKLNFPPTYKYELNSEKYYGEDPKVGRRTPAWYESNNFYEFVLSPLTVIFDLIASCLDSGYILTPYTCFWLLFLSK